MISKAKVINIIASAIAAKEGKKHQASIGDIREIVSIILHDNMILNALMITDKQLSNNSMLLTMIDCIELETKKVKPKAKGKK